MSVIGIGALICAIFALLGVVFLAIGLVRRRMVRGWVSTTGMIVDSGGLLSGLPAQYPTFRWRDQSGREHQHTSSVHGSFGPRPGTLVEVKYDPRDPSRGMLTGLAQSGLIFVIIGGLMFVPALLGIAFYLMLLLS